MRKIILSEFGGPEVLRVADAPEPEVPQDGWVVELRAIGINFAELVERRGLYRKNQKTPYEMGKEAAGVIIAAGPEAMSVDSSDGAQRGFQVGQRVIVIRFGGGCYAERVAVRPGQVLPAPPHLDFDELASFAISFATAWYAQEELARARPGECALIHAAAGAVGSAAVLLARACGLGPVFGTAGSDEKCAAVRALGATECFNYRALPEGAGFANQIRARTHGRGVDYCLESIGGEVFDQSLELSAPLARIVVIGFSSIGADYAQAIARVHPLKLFLRSIGLFGLNVEQLDFPARRDVWTRMLAVVEAHELRPLVGRRFALDEAPEAHAHIEARENFGKVVLIP